ncbi:MAG: hypothetical protein BMS9Abin13_377 [Patescibacteria group bacterium]|nr:MAG: hypothetical protein BMS9Abin13_377 [Patescibacteria group bacterium]
MKKRSAGIKKDVSTSPIEMDGIIIEKEGEKSGDDKDIDALEEDVAGKEKLFSALGVEMPTVRPATNDSALETRVVKEELLDEGNIEVLKSEEIEDGF